MDPLTALGAAGLGYALYRAKVDAPDKSAEVSPVVKTREPVNSKQLSPTQMSVMVTQLLNTAVTETQLASINKTNDDILGNLSKTQGFDLVGLIAQAVTAAIIPFAVLAIEIDELSRGRNWYKEQLRMMAASARNKLEIALVASPLTATQRKDFAQLFGYELARGYNRAGLAFTSTLQGQGFVALFADRGWVIEEPEFVESKMMRHPGLPRVLAANEGYGGSLEYHILDARTDYEVAAALGANWGHKTSGIADFVGRAMGCTQWQHKMRNVGGSLKIHFYDPLPAPMIVGIGAIGLTQPVAINTTPFCTRIMTGNDAFLGGNAGQWGSSLVNADKGYIEDGTGRTALRWHYRDSENQLRAVVKQP